MNDNILQIAKQIKLLILDVDGVLTDGSLFYFAEAESKAFNARDGLGLALLIKAGVDLAIISGNHSVAVEKRFQKFAIKHVHQGISDKKATYEMIKKDLKLPNQAIAYMGDDLIDLPVMTQVGLPTAVADADAFVAEQALWVSQFAGGKGAVRELCELILNAQGKLDTLRKSFLVPKDEK